MKTPILFSTLFTVLLSSACSAPEFEPSSMEEESAPAINGFAHLELEVVGEGTVFVDAPESKQCTWENGICQFTFPIGSEITIRADFSDADEHNGFYGECEGQEHCRIVLDHHTTVHADFTDIIVGI